MLGAIILMVGVHAVPYVRDHGVGLATASLALTAYGIGSVCGRLTSGAVSDRFGTRATMRVGVCERSPVKSNARSSGMTGVPSPRTRSTAW